MVNKTEIKIISLVKDVVRREYILSQLSQFNAVFDFFDAIDGNSIPEDVQLRFDDARTVRLRGYPLTRNEKGCFASHFLLWQYSVENNKNLIIIEDDAIISREVLDFIDSPLTEKYEYIKLERRSNGKPTDDGCMKLYNNHSGAVGYFLTPVAAKKFIESAVHIDQPVDHYFGRAWVHKVPPIGLVKPIVKHSYTFETNIQDGRKKAEKGKGYSLRERASRKALKLIDRLKYWYFYAVT